jgi:hypothetical protein
MGSQKFRVAVQLGALLLLRRNGHQHHQQVLASTHDVHGRKAGEINGDIIPPYWRQL